FLMCQLCLRTPVSDLSGLNTSRVMTAFRVEKGRARDDVAPSLRGAKRRSNPYFSASRDGLLRFARNDGSREHQPYASSPASALACAGGTGIGNFSKCFGKFTGR